jgi:hypothetical protein
MLIFYKKLLIDFLREKLNFNDLKPHLPLKVFLYFLPSLEHLEVELELV